MVTENNPFGNEIAHFTDKRITEILNDSSNYSSLLVYGCKREADLRNLDINENFMSDNPFSADVEAYSDAKLSAMLDGNIEYSPKLLDACRMEGAKRGLKPPNKKDSGFSSRDDIIQVQQSLKNGMSVDSIKNYLIDRGYSDEDALVLINKAVESKEIVVVHEEKKSSSGIGVFGVLFMVYVVAKWIYILSR